VILPVPGYLGYYVTSAGKVISPKGITLKARPNNYGYPRACLYNAGIRKDVYVHTLVLTTFGFDKPGPEYQVDHIDGNRSNNSLDNLEWVTQQENLRRRDFRLGGPEGARPWRRKSHLPCVTCGVRPRKYTGGVYRSYCIECFNSYKRQWRKNRKN
jgi:hypothetical protein